MHPTSDGLWQDSATLHHTAEVLDCSLSSLEGSSTDMHAGKVPLSQGNE